MSTSETKKNAYLLVTLIAGHGTQLSYSRYTDWPSDRKYGSDTYISVPSLEVKLGASTGDLDEKPSNLELPYSSDDAILASVSSGEPAPRLRAQIREITISETTTSDKLLFNGYGRRSLRNPEGKPGRVLLELVVTKQLLQAQVSLPCNPECALTFGEHGCFVSLSQTPNVDKEALTQTGVLATVTGALVTITGLVDGASSVYWKDGYLELNGVRVKIRNWKSDNPESFTLVRTPPSAWLGASIQVTPGCTKSSQRCEEWGNTGQFAGYGIKIPDYNPVLEEPTA